MYALVPPAVSSMRFDNTRVLYELVHTLASSMGLDSTPNPMTRVRVRTDVDMRQSLWRGCLDNNYAS